VADPVDEAAGRLYALPLEEFTRARDALARELRKAKERDAAAAVAKLKKPSQAAWAANQLSREQRDLVDDLLAAGEDLREAQENAMAGKGAEALRDAAATERAAVDALVTAAKELRPSGRKPTDATLDRLRTTLHAAAADEEVRAALEAGRLVEDVEGGGAWGMIGGVAPAPRKERPERPAPRKRAADKEGPAREAREREERLREERERRQRLEGELREARAERRARDRELDRAEREAARAAQRLEAALAAAEEARTYAEEAKAELEATREAAEQARDEVAKIEEQLD
jgi:hypothetical protein